MSFNYEVNFNVFNERLKELEEREEGTLERIHYVEADQLFRLYYDNYCTIITYESIVNSGMWDSVDNFKLTFLNRAIEIIDIFKQPKLTVQVSGE